MNRTWNRIRNHFSGRTVKCRCLTNGIDLSNNKRIIKERRSLQREGEKKTFHAFERAYMPIFKAVILGVRQKKEEKVRSARRPKESTEVDEKESFSTGLLGRRGVIPLGMLWNDASEYQREYQTSPVLLRSRGLMSMKAATTLWILRGKGLSLTSKKGRAKAETPWGLSEPSWR